MMKRIGKYLCGLCLILALCAAPVLAGCGRDFDPNAGWDDIDDGEQVTLSFMHMWPEHREIFTELAKEFQQLHENVTLSISVSTAENILKSLQTAHMSGDMPDVYTYFTHYMSPLVLSSDGVMAADISRYYEEMKGDFIGDGEMWNMGKIDGKYYSVPFRTTSILIFYNKTLFEEYGFEVPRTFEEFERLVRRMKSNSETRDYIPLAASGKNNNSIVYLLSAMQLYDSILSGAVNEEGYFLGRLEPDYDDMENNNLIYGKMREWYAGGYFGNNARGQSDNDVMSQFMEGNALMCYANNNQASTLISGMDGCEIGAFAIPAPASLNDAIRYVYGGYDGLSVSATSPNKQWAMEWIKFLTSKEVQARFANEEHSIVVNKHVTYDDAQMRSYAEASQYVGRYAIAPDYLTGTNAEQNNNLIMNYVAGDNTYTAETLVRAINNNVYRDMQDTMLNDPPKTWMPWKGTIVKYDNSWLKYSV